MDLDPKLFGPFADVYLRERAKCVERDRKERAKWADFAARHKKKNTRFELNAELKRETRLSAMKENEKKRRSDLFMNSRKTDMAKVADDLNDILHEETGEISSVDLDVNLNTTEKSKVMESSSSSSSSSQTSTYSSKSKVLGNGTNVSNNVGKNGIRDKAPQPEVKTNANIANAKKTADEARREKLLKWKKEKEVATQIAKRNEKRPFKVGVVAPLPNRPGKAAAPPAPAPAPSTSQPIRNGKPVDGTAAKSLPETRRVTRAMVAKTQPTATNPTPATGRAAMNFNFKKTAAANKTVEPSLHQKFKGLDVKEKPTTSVPLVPTTTSRNGKVGVPSKAGQSSKPPAPSSSTVRTAAATTAVRKGPQTQPLRVPATGKPKEKNGSSNGLNTNVKNQSKSVKEAEPVAKSLCKSNSPEQAQTSEVRTKKRGKPSGFDPVHIEFNGKLSSSCTKLNQYSVLWHRFLEESPDLPEKVDGDIRSSLGKVKLLLESKLPQFWELLDAYVRKEGGPEGSSQVLPCDLQGWWDVASIQLESIDETFQRLANLKENNWETPVEQVPSVNTEIVNVKKSPKPRAALPSRPTKPAKASSGLKAFLAQQRMKQQNPDAPIDEPMKSATHVANKTPIKSAGLEDPECNKTFDGGFFSVQSPKPKPSTTPSRRLLELRQSEAGLMMSPPPNRRSSTASQASHRRMSTCILRVRSSMGQLSKIGVSTPQDDDTLNSSHLSHISSHTTEEMEA